MKARFYLCKICGNLIIKLIDSGVTPVCCSSEMVELKANTIEGVSEKHLPVVVCCVKGRVSVTVGENAHPMTVEHYIQFIVLETEESFQIRYLKPGMKPETEFCLSPDDRVVAIYAYCNIHGLWKTSCR